MKRFSYGLSILVVLFSLLATNSAQAFAQEPAQAETKTPTVDEAKPSL